MRSRLLCVLFLFSLNSSFAAPANLCWTEKVENGPDGIRVYLMKDYIPGIRLEPRGTKTIMETHPVPGTGYFVMQEGDTAYLQGGPHDVCTLVAERQADDLGVRFKAVFRPHGLPPDEREEFVSGSPAQRP